jgi:hypothetical protein
MGRPAVAPEGVGMVKLFKPAHGHGALLRGGKKKGQRNTVSRNFREIAEQILNDPDVVLALKRRVLLELAGRQSRPVPALAVLGAACGGEKAKERDARGAVVFAVSIQQGRGVVERVEEAPPPLLEAHAEIAPEPATTNEKEEP